MTLLPEISNLYLASFAFGLLYGSTFCTSACLPYATSYIAGIGAGFRKWTSIIGARTLIVLGAGTLLNTLWSTTFEGEKKWQWKS